MSQVSLGRPEFVPGTPPGHPDRQIPLCDFSLSVFFSLLMEIVVFCHRNYCFTIRTSSLSSREKLCRPPPIFWLKDILYILRPHAAGIL